MTQARDPADETETDRHTTTRRAVLGALAGVGGVAALAELGDADSHRSGTSLGGNPRESAGAAYYRGGFYFGPQTIPPGGEQ